MRAAAPGALLAALVAFFAFRGGGLGVDVVGIAAVVLLAGLAVWVVAAEDPFAGWSRGLAVALGALAGLAVLSAVSAAWSATPARALDESIRVLLYAAVLAVFGLVARGPRALTGLAAGLALAATGVCLAALASRLAPDVVQTTPNVYPSRLSWPVTYWNALGLLAAVALVLLLAAAARGERLAVRVAAAAAVPAVAATLLLTFSRGSLAVAVLGLAGLAFALRSGALIAALTGVAVPSAVAVAAALRADLLAGDDPASAAAAAQGHDLGLVVLACCAAAGLLRAALARVEPRLWPGRWARAGAEHGGRAARRGRGGRDGRGGARAAAAVAMAGVLALVLLLATGAADRVRSGFEARPDRAGVLDARERLLDASGGGRDAYWRVAVDGFADAPLAGSGAGSFRSRWQRERPALAEASRAHALPLETLADLGLLGFALHATALGACLWGLWRRRRDPAGAALLVAAVAWLVHAAFDWDWHLPAVTLWVVAAGGAALARAGAQRARPAPGLAARAAGALALLVLAAAPALVAVSARQAAASVEAAARGDCAAAVERAADARRVVDLRPEPWAVTGQCAAREGRLAEALAALRAARDRAPGDWEHPYAEAVVRGAAGDAGAASAVREALARNPLQPDARALAGALAGPPAERKRRARGARLFLDGDATEPLGG